MRLLAALLLALVTSASGAELAGRVVSIADGDTVTVLDADHVQHIVRLAGIDAPEKRQPFGNVSRQHLAGLVFQRDVTVEWKKRDRYGRMIGVVRIDGQDASLAQVQAGLAWHYLAYAGEQRPADRLAYADAEQQARADRQGLWRDLAPVPPWEWRHLKQADGAGISPDRAHSYVDSQ